AAVSDPHEIANVLGVGGIEFMIDNSAQVPFNFIFGAPSCVPATSFETAGASITADDIDKLFRNGKVTYLSEMMNFPGVIHHNPDVMAKIEVARKYDKPADGHAPGLSGEALRQYAAAGISTDHECSALEEAEEKIRLGMKILIREGSAAKNFDALYPLIEKYPDRVMFCTDDFHPDDLLRGHINTLLAKGITKELDLFSLLRAATLNPVRHYRIDQGLLQTDDPADFIVVDNLKYFTVLQSFLRGICLYDRVGEEVDLAGILRKDSPKAAGGGRGFPNRFGASKINVSDLQVIAAASQMKLMQVFDGDLFTKQVFCDVQKFVPVTSDIDGDILKIAVLNRYHPAKPAVAFVRGFGLKRGALASTVAHDSHHIVAVGCDDDSIVTVINHIIDMKGGLAAYCDQQLIDLKLDIAGLMSSASGEEVAQVYGQLNRAASRMGSTLTSPFMALSFMALLVIPELKLSDKGLFDVNRFGWTGLFTDA
ncbi:MAG: adenine deaminase, partial [Bacteroidales bacterium]|nr:adenine deaminase [Bacteroidales bacterium]